MSLEEFFKKYCIYLFNQDQIPSFRINKFNQFEYTQIQHGIITTKVLSTSFIRNLNGRKLPEFIIFNGLEYTVDVSDYYLKLILI